MNAADLHKKLRRLGPRKALVLRMKRGELYQQVIAREPRERGERFDERDIVRPSITPKGVRWFAFHDYVTAHAEAAE